jgi:HTH-type transcriptional regulator, glycine betaine synthesis regulator
LRYSQFHQKVNPSNESNTLPEPIAPADPSSSGDVSYAGRVEERAALSDVECEVIDICVRAAQAFGVSRSLGEIFGLIFCARKPVNFDFVVRSLRISTGSASHGLRRMCKLGVIRSCYVPRDRRVHYVLETSLRGLVVALLGENLLVQLSLANEQIERLRSRLNDGNSARLELAPQVELLASWNSRFRAALKPMLEALS